MKLNDKVLVESDHRLTLDGRKRVNLAKILTEADVSSFKVYLQDDIIILEPMAEIPARELWLYKNPNAMKAVQEGLKQSKQGKVKKRGSFKQHVDNEL